jgi:formylglycine-generating enzyme required for sulfatase activity
MITRASANSVIIVTLFAGGAAAAEPSGLEFAFVPAADVQPGGPAYDYRITRFEIRNDRFAAFLNDALGNLDNQRGQFMYFDTDSGDVYIHSATRGVLGTNGSGTHIFKTAANGHISYDATRGTYQVADGFENHPVTGVSWFGAVKFCNWLTIDAGLGLDERAYTEAPSGDLSAWHPVTITTAAWAGRDLNSEERDALLTKLGYRLPMDGGVDGAGPYNEWLKAAASRLDGAGVAFDAVFGFGRSAILPQDANYNASGDPYEPGTTPVGFYDGTDHGGVFTTSASDNAYGVFDLSGNVWEWLQDQNPTDPAQRRNRGGSWRSLANDLRVTLGVQRSATAAEDSAGFRVVQRVIHDLLVTPPDELAASGPWGGPYDEPGSDRITYRLMNVIAVPVSFTVTPDESWIIATPTAGSVDPGEALDVTISLQPDCTTGPPPGDSVSRIRFINGDGQTVAERALRVTVREPLTLTPSSGFTSRMPFGRTPLPPNAVYTFANASDLSVQWSATVEEASEATWVTLPTSGDVLPGGVEPIVVGIDANVARSFVPGTYTADVTLVDDCTGETFVRAVTLDVLAPFSISPEEESFSTGVFAGPFDPTFHLLTVANLVNGPVTWTVTMCSEEPGSAECTPPPQPTWLEVDLGGGTLPTNETQTVTASITTAADGLQTGVYSLTLRFQEPDTGFSIDRVVTLEVTGLLVEPDRDVELRGPSGGPFEPALFVYSVRNTGLVEMSWSVSLTFDPPLEQLGGLTWLDVVPTSGVIVDDTGVDEVTVSPTVDAASLTPGTYTCTMQFSANGATAVRKVTLIVGDEAFSVPMVTVPEADVQPLGPAYDYRIGRYEITNTEFVHFLNNARRNAVSGIPGVPDARSHYMYFDIDSGDVYINDQQAGEEGVEAPSAALSTLLFDADVGGAVSFVDDQYVVEDGKESLPVVGVTWYGAVKLCNWLTWLQGMRSPDERVYHEGPSPADWYPLAAPSQIIALRGFRLPMDGRADAADPSNEWYKAAAWSEAGQTNAAYGFGRDVLTGADANFRDSGDPSEPGPTPVGFFNGVNDLADGTTPTSDTDNAYDLYDMSGNVAEWIHDEGINPDERGIRGGHFDSLPASPLLRADARGSVPADAALGFVGFRIAQAVEAIELVLSRPAGEPGRATGFAGGPIDRETFTLLITNPGRQTADNISIAVNVNWLTVQGVAPTQVPPGGTIEVPLSVAATTTGLGVSPAPPGDFVLVPADDHQTNGPDYDFWISRIEVTNGHFTAFLSDARANARSRDPDVRSDHMYFDLDSGGVYLSDTEAGDEGFDAPSAALTTLLYDASVGRIQFADDAYAVQAGFENHPVVGVTWYGAVKYCNWLTINQGIPAPLRVYAEAPSPNVDGWHPVVVDDATWSGGPMNDTARRFVVEDTAGYRLPMDDGAAGASPFNEWYKAASRKGPDDQGNVVFGAVYGYGRDDPPAGPDANHFQSGDTEQDATTPVRFFNGQNTLFQAPTNCFPPPPDPTRTRDTDNGYGLYDASGNAAEWTQDFFADTPAHRATRGGAWRDPADSVLLTTTGRGSRRPDVADDQTGFRVVRGTGHVATVTVSNALAGVAYRQHYILDLREPLTIEPRTGADRSGRYGDTFAGLLESYTLTNRSDSDTDWEVLADRGWVDVVESVSGESSGTMAGPEALVVDVTLNEQADRLAPGAHAATVTLRNVTTGQPQTRAVTLTIDPPISVVPTDPDPQAFTAVWGGPFGLLARRTFELVSDVSFDLDYNVGVDQPWLTVEPADPDDDLSGTLPPAGSLFFVVGVDDTADTLPVGEYNGAVRFTFIDRGNDDLSDNVEQAITLNVAEPIVVIGQFPDPWRIASDLDPAALPSQIYTLTNDADIPIEVIISVDAEWVDIDASLLEVLPGSGQQRLLTVSLNENALTLFDGEHVATVTVEDTVTGIVQCPTIVLDIVENLSVAPFDDFEAAGVAGGPINPAFSIYRLTNIARDGSGPIQWSASVVTPGATWILINGQPTANGSLDDGEAVNVVISIDAAATVGLSEGIHDAIVEFRVLPADESVTRTVSLRLVVPQFALAESFVSAVIEQPAGPLYSYNMATFHTTNAEFVAFLNDAMQNPSIERGQYMFFDTTTGDVYVNSSMPGETGADPGPRTLKMFSPSASGRIELFGGAYRIVPDVLDYAEHPVTGVSWYGALKYCNWLTIDQGMLPVERCYTEGADTDAASWHPVSITTADWLARDLTDDERLDLVTRCRGYRLPMDQGGNNTDVTTDQADAYNEWYKAAAFNASLRQNIIYGFGRGLLAGADANFRDSGDPLDNGTTPVGYFDGSIKGASFATNSNENGFGIFDMTGNAYQWVQGRFNAHPDSIDFRTLRGGGWSTAVDSPHLRTDARTFLPGDATNAQVGFRVVRTLSPPTGDFDYDGDVDRADHASMAVCLAGPADASSPTCSVFDLHADTLIDLRDFAAFQVVFARTP